MSERTPVDPAEKARTRPRTGLGRGLSALLGDTASAEEQGRANDAPQNVRTMPVSALSPHPGQPRRHFDEAALDELADSIRTHGIIQPIVVRPRGKGYQIIAGERRWRAAQRARLHEVPVVVREMGDAETLEVALIENIQRQDLNAIEEAQAYRKLIVEFDHSQDALGKIVNKSRSHVANLLRLLDLPAPVQAMVIDGGLQMGHARALIGAPDAERLAIRVRDEGLSVRETEKLARVAKPDAARRERQPSFDHGRADFSRDADIAALEQQLGDVLGLKVRIAHGDKGGTLTLNYATLDQLDMVCQRLSGEII